MDLPQVCNIQYENGTELNQSWFHTTSCSNCLCIGIGSCLNHRCCCTQSRTTSLSYQCLNYHDGERVWIYNLAEQCTCSPCDNAPVSFLIRVIDEQSWPLPLVNVTLESNHWYLTDEFGYVGFSINGNHSQTLLSVSAIGYESFKQSYFVIPGHVNRHEIVLLRLRSAVVDPPSTAFLIHTDTLVVTPLPTLTHFTLQPITALNLDLPTSDNHINTFLYFPPSLVK